MTTIKTGTWANVNGTRLFVTVITDKVIKGVTVDESGATQTLSVAISDVTELTRSRKPAYLHKKLDIKHHIKFGQVDFDEETQCITAVRMLVDNKIKQVI